VAIDERGAICVVTEIRANAPAWPVIFAVKASGAAYKGRPETFKAVVGSVDLAAFKAASGAAGGAREKRSAGTDVDFLVPTVLKGVKVGDTVRLKHRYEVVEATYLGYNRNRPKYPVTYELNGKRWKGPLEIVVGKVA